MDLSPNDVRNYEFPSQMRGYDKEEVNNFKEQVAAALEAAKQENLKLTMELESVKSQLSGLKQFEDTIKNAAIDARRNADLTVNNAKQEAEMILKKARSDAEKDIESRASRIEVIENQIAKLQLSKKSYYTKIRSLIQSHLELIDELGRKEHLAPPQTKAQIDIDDDEVESEDNIEVTDSSEVDSRRREMIASVPTKTKGIRTEEANAPEADSEGTADSGRQMLEKAIKDADDETRAEFDMSGDEEEMEAEPPAPPKPSNTPGIDPELAAALENYQKAARHQSDPAPVAPPPPPAGGLTKTDARAEDVPQGFVPANEEQLMEQAATDTGPVNRGANRPSAESVEPNPMPAERQPVGPDSIAKELDDVVARFEEEMDKAARS